MEIRKLSIKDYEEIYGLWMSTPGIGSALIDASLKALKDEGISRLHL